ncbi:MAG: hypothetical protein HGB12_16865, partial [Bacteroidetes bacterium]|nr:hypothetical protein [Bacteroidota bacterium]
MKTLRLHTGLFIISFFLFSYIGINAQNNDIKIKKDLTELKLLGNVKSLTQTEFYAVNYTKEIKVNI